MALRWSASTKEDIELRGPCGIQQIAHLLVVNLHERNEARVVHVLLRLADVDLVKQVFERPGKQTLGLCVQRQGCILSRRPENRIRLSRTRLPIRKDTPVVSSQAVVRDVLSNSLKETFLPVNIAPRMYLGTRFVKHRIKGKGVRRLAPVGKGDRRRLACYASPPLYTNQLSPEKPPAESFNPTGHTRQNTRMKSVFSPSSIDNVRNPGEVTIGIGIWRSFLNGVKRPPVCHSPFSQPNALQSVVYAAPKFRSAKGTIHVDGSLLDFPLLPPEHRIACDRSFSAEWADEEHAFSHSTGYGVWRCAVRFVA